uniref:Uncharacterized protein n=1 Tax=Glossina brevipalpis TaxID=37001 RepID=A0A1A9WL76_9MUSC
MLNNTGISGNMYMCICILFLLRLLTNDVLVVTGPGWHSYHCRTLLVTTVDASLLWELLVRGMAVTSIVGTFGAFDKMLLSVATFSCSTADFLYLRLFLLPGNGSLADGIALVEAKENHMQPKKFSAKEDYHLLSAKESNSSMIYLQDND